jgi:hypothetical protein
MDWNGNETYTVEWNKIFRTMLLAGLFSKIIGRASMSISMVVYCGPFWNGLAYTISCTS